MTLTDQLRRDEGVAHLMYTDPMGLPTIGVGHNLLIPISDRAIEQILADDISASYAACRHRFEWFEGLSECRRGVILNMAFNLGVDGLAEFRHMLGFVADSRWDEAADAMLDSLWARQVPLRAGRLAAQMRQDIWH